MKGFAPKEICRQLGLCLAFESSEENIDDLALDEALIVSVVASPSDMMSRVPLYKNQLTTRFTETPECILCEFVMSRLEKELADKKTQAEIKHTIENICKKMPKSISADCTKFVDQYADLIISLVDTVPPKEICAQMMLCGPARLASEAEVVECAVCHGAVQALDTIIADPKIDEDIDHVFEKACNQLPAKYNKKCSNLVEIYGPSILNLLKSLTQPDKVCIEIAMCHPSNMSGFIKLEDM
jgi:saposin